MWNDGKLSITRQEDDSCSCCGEGGCKCGPGCTCDGGCGCDAGKCAGGACTCDAGCGCSCCAK